MLNCSDDVYSSGSVDDCLFSARDFKESIAASARALYSFAESVIRSLTDSTFDSRTGTRGR